MCISMWVFTTFPTRLALILDLYLHVILYTARIDIFKDSSSSFLFKIAIPRNSSQPCFNNFVWTLYSADLTPFFRFLRLFPVILFPVRSSGLRIASNPAVCSQPMSGESPSFLQAGGGASLLSCPPSELKQWMLVVIRFHPGTPSCQHHPVRLQLQPDETSHPSCNK